MGTITPTPVPAHPPITSINQTIRSSFSQTAGAGGAQSVTIPSVNTAKSQLRFNTVPEHYTVYTGNQHQDGYSIYITGSTTVTLYCVYSNNPLVVRFEITEWT